MTYVHNNINENMLTGYGYECSVGDPNTAVDQRYVYVWDPNGSHRSFRYNASAYSINGYQWWWMVSVVD